MIPGVPGAQREEGVADLWIARGPLWPVLRGTALGAAAGEEQFLIGSHCFSC